MQKEAEEHTLGRCGPEPKALGSWKGRFRRGLQLGAGWTESRRRKGQRVRGIRAPLSGGEGLLVWGRSPGTHSCDSTHPPTVGGGCGISVGAPPRRFRGGGGAWRGPGVVPCARRPGLRAGVWGRGPGKSGSGLLAQGGVFLSAGLSLSPVRPEQTGQGSHKVPMPPPLPGCSSGAEC